MIDTIFCDLFTAKLHCMVVDCSLIGEIYTGEISQ
jgi:hypothetical protein